MSRNRIRGNQPKVPPMSEDNTQETTVDSAQQSQDTSTDQASENLTNETLETSENAVVDSQPKGALNPQPEPTHGAGDADEEPAQKPAVLDKGTQDNSTTESAESIVETKEIPAVTAETVETSLASTQVVSTVAKEALTDFAKLLERINTAGTPPQKALVRKLQEYMTAMAPGTPMNAQNGSKWQQNLWILIKGVIDNTDNLEFRKQWFILLSFFNEYGGNRQVFSGRYVFRFADQWTRSPDDLAAMQRLINVMHLTAKVEDRAQGLKQVDLDRSLATGFTPIARQNLISFYKNT